MQVELYHNESLPQVLNKKLNLIDTVDGQFTQVYDLMNATMRLTGNINLMTYSKVNYMKLDGKCYYITNWSVNADQVIDVILHLDALETYKDTIRHLDVILDRASHDYQRGVDPEDAEPDVLHYQHPENKYITDDMYPTTGLTDIEDILFDFEFDDSEEAGTYILLTSQTGYTPVGGSS